MKLLHLLLELLFPRKCILCNAMLPGDQTDICRDCRTTTPEWSPIGTIHPALDSVTAVWYYDSNVRESLLRFKFSGCRHYAKPYARLLAMGLLRSCPETELITWVPVSPFRRMKRGYDQSELLARAVAAELGIPAVRCLRKRRHNPAQSGLADPAARRDNVREAYHAVRTENLRGRKLILVDDILTTGATAGECARVLKQAGADRVALAVVASRRPKKTN